ncbi:MAG TPA: metal ABC transporter substrate-binding protein [Dermatophilaceae bacterium]|jgi:zinc transport system substrate-binding protein
MTTRSLRVVPLRVAPLIIAALALSACGSAGVAANGTVGGRLAVVASFYPLQFATQQVGGDFVAVTSLTRPGAEPHDIELTPRDVATVSRASLVVYEKGLQGAVDQAVESEGGNRGLDVAPAAHLDLRLASGTTDPHFWLDPQRYSEVATVIAGRLARIDPAHQAEYETNAKAFGDKLTALSGELTTGLANCRRRDIVTSHSAFAYFAKRFGMRQIAINGISPDQEPKAGALAAVSTYVKAHGVTTIYAETLASPAIAQTVADETGASMATLDPIEGLTSRSSGKDYFEIMRSNLTALRAGQGCS